MEKILESLPMIPLRGMTILPEMVVHFDISRKKSIEAVQEAMVGDQRIFLVTQREVETEEPQQKELFEIGTIGTIKQVIKLPKKILRILVVGEERAMLRNIECGEPYMRALVEVEREEKKRVARGGRNPGTGSADRSTCEKSERNVCRIRGEKSES